MLLLIDWLTAFLEKTLKKEEDTKLTKAELKKREADLMRKEQAKRMGINLDDVKKEKKEAEKEVAVIKKDIEERKANGEVIENTDELIEDALYGVKPNLNHILRD